MTTDELRFYLAGFFSPIILISVLVLWLSFLDWLKAAARRWKARRYNAIYSLGYDAGKRDCKENR